jgi:hypothetical protein
VDKERERAGLSDSFVSFLPCLLLVMEEVREQV